MPLTLCAPTFRCLAHSLVPGELSAVQIPESVEAGPQVRKLAFAACGPGFCEAVGPMDAAFVKDATGSADATVTIYDVQGRAINFQLATKGFDKAIAALSH